MNKRKKQLMAFLTAMVMVVTSLAMSMPAYAVSYYDFVNTNRGDGLTITESLGAMYAGDYFYENEPGSDKKFYDVSENCIEHYDNYDHFWRVPNSPDDMAQTWFLQSDPLNYEKDYTISENDISLIKTGVKDAVNGSGIMLSVYNPGCYVEDANVTYEWHMNLEEPCSVSVNDLQNKWDLEDTEDGIVNATIKEGNVFHSRDSWYGDDAAIAYQFLNQKEDYENVLLVEHYFSNEASESDFYIDPFSDGIFKDEEGTVRTMLAYDNYSDPSSTKELKDFHIRIRALLRKDVIIPGATDAQLTLRANDTYYNPDAEYYCVIRKDRIGVEEWYGTTFQYNLLYYSKPMSVGVIPTKLAHKPEGNGVKVDEYGPILMTYNGQKQIAYAAGEGYTLLPKRDDSIIDEAGNMVGQNIGIYEGWIELEDGYMWDDETTSSMMVMLFQIVPCDLAKTTVTLAANSYTYDGTAKTPAVTVKSGEAILPASDYSVSYQNNTNVGTATVTITPKTDNLTGSISKTFTIAAAKVEPTPTPTPEVKAPAKGDEVSDNKTKATYEVTNAKSGKEEVAYSGSTDAKANTITIKDTVKINGTTYKITKVDDKAFKGNKKITKVTLGKNIKEIGKDAFNGATKLTTVKVGKNVTTVGNNAFKGCSSLKSVSLDTKVSKIGANAFNGCKKMTTLVIKSTKLTDKNINKNAFKGITKKTTIKVPKKKVKAYKTLFKKKGLSKTVQIVGI